MADEERETAVFTESGSNEDRLFLRSLVARVQTALDHDRLVSVLCVGVFGIPEKKAHLSTLTGQFKKGFAGATDEPFIAQSSNDELWIILLDHDKDCLFTRTVALHSQLVEYSPLIAEMPTLVCTGVGFSPFSTDRYDDLVFQASLALLRAHSHRCDSGALRFHKQIDV